MTQVVVSEVGIGVSTAAQVRAMTHFIEMAQSQ